MEYTSVLNGKIELHACQDESDALRDRAETMEWSGTDEDHTIYVYIGHLSNISNAVPIITGIVESREDTNYVVDTK